ncbi:hypothetical protein TL16_g09988 [Triparma laevis f. inornata]|uniref:Uncharacterized protein n=1 Tax=Triparma laevis f. inornata TaxID=1714386 RepID=A0A9W7BB02_9STRA|nr:hypothetical protein TL16_g09988 [Triparma laevis f. inornata]
MGGDLVEIKKGSSNQSKIVAMVHRALERALKLSGTSKDGGKGLLHDLEEQFLSIIANSNGDDVHFLELYVGVWYAEKWPHEELDKQEVENMKGFLVMVARRAARLKDVKKRRMGATVKIVSTLFIGYFDIMTDFLVAKSYYEQDKMNMAYGTAGCALLAIMMQAVTTFFQYGRKPLRERMWRTLVAMTGLGPLMEGKRLWMGVEDTDLVVTAPVMFAGMKALEVSFEAVPEAIIQVSGLLSANLDEIKWIQIVGVISSVVCGAFIMTDGNFGFIQSKHMKSPWDPFYNWVPRHPGFGKMSCKFGMFLFILCYFSQFIWSMSLFGEYGEVWRQGRACFFFIGIEYLVVCAYMGRKGEAFGVSVVSHPLSRRDHVLPFILWGLYYLLVCAAPMLIAAAPCELGPEVFSSVIVWRLFTNGILTFIALQRLPASHYLTVQTGMLMYWFCLIGALLGLAIFFRNCNKNFTISTFWKPISAKKHVKRIWRDPRVWEKAYMTKDEEIWGWVWKIHPTYLPFDALTTWLCEDLVNKYGGWGGEEGGLERPDYLSGKFVTRMYTIYLWRKDLDEEEARRVDSALNILFGREGGKRGIEWGRGEGENVAVVEGETEIRPDYYYLTSTVKKRGRKLPAKVKVGPAIWENFMS